MIKPDQAELLIFDLDGTILQSDKATLEAVKRAIFKMGLDIWVEEEEIRKHLGETSEDFYKNILPPQKHALWRELRSGVRDQYEFCLKKFGDTFPGVKETLGILKKRGYKLALYSNSSLPYFNNAISALGIKDFFIYSECNEENNLDKVELVRKISNKFLNPGCAVIGDRIHDMQAAEKNNALSIGALYGYGKNEFQNADISINEFSQLLNIFDRKLPIFEKILKEIKKRKKEDKAFVVGINGIDTSGKTKFAEALTEFLNSKNCKTRTINLDDFHNPKKIRYSGKNQAENYYNKSFDIRTIVKELLLPISRKKKFSKKIMLLDLHSDEYQVQKEFSFDRNTIVVFEGVFLFRKELSPYIDYKIFIEVPFEESKNRAKIRDVPIYGRQVLKKYDEKYLPAQKKYLKEFPPHRMADMIIDNVNWEYPKTIKFNE